MKKILIIAGPNGAGKTTFAEEFLPNEAACPEFVNADLIAAGLSPFQPERMAFTAGRLMLARIGELTAAGTSFAFETTLATRSWVPRISRWQATGYRVQLHFLKLPDPDFAIRRVERRVLQGGHSIPAETIRRRFGRGLENLDRVYLRLVDEWFIYDGSTRSPLLLDAGEGRAQGNIMEDSATYRAADTASPPIASSRDREIIGALAALARGSAKAIARDRVLGLEPVIRPNPDEKEP